MGEPADLDRIVMAAAAAQVPHGQLKRVEVEPYINSVGDEGLRITLVMADDVPRSPDGDVIANTMLAVSDRLAELGEQREPSFVFVTERELADIGDPDT